jgi:hypothetical protein
MPLLAIHNSFQSISKGGDKDAPVWNSQTYGHPVPLEERDKKERGEE